MSESVVCRGCGRRVRLPDSINRSKARCPKCRTKLEVLQSAPPKPDVYQIFLTESQPLEPVKVPPPAVEVLSRDDAPPAEPRPIPKPQPVPEVAFFPPPFPFPVEILSDSRKLFSGEYTGVLTPHGLFVEIEPSKPFLFAPVGTPCECEGSRLTLVLPDRVLKLKLRGVPKSHQLTADAVAFLSGQRPVPLPAEYRRDWWLVGVGAVFALGLVAEVSLGTGLVMAASLAVIVATLNASLVLFTQLSTGTKIALMASLCALAWGLVLIVAFALMAEPHAVEPSPGPPPAEESPPGVPPSPPEEPRAPPSHLDIVYRDGRTRLDDGPANVTALAVSPDGSIFIGYADGSTRIWPLDQPAFESPRLGPRAGGAVRHIAFDRTGKLALLNSDGGLVLASINPPSRTPILIPGEHVVVNLEPKRERFAAVRTGRIFVRYFPFALLKDPPANRAVGGFFPIAAKDETLPLGVPPPGILLPGGKPTFLAYHPSERLIAGNADGSITVIPASGPAAKATTFREHKAAVRTWTVSPWGDFATGDDDGFVGYWPNKTSSITKFKTGGVAIQGLAFSPCGGELAVVDTSGWVSVWDPVLGKKQFEVKQKQPIAAVSYGPHEDVLMLADEKGVEIWWIPELAAQTSSR